MKSSKIYTIDRHNRKLEANLDVRFNTDGNVGAVYINIEAYAKSSHLFPDITIDIKVDILSRNETNLLYAAHFILLFIMEELTYDDIGGLRMAMDDVVGSHSNVHASFRTKGYAFLKRHGLASADIVGIPQLTIEIVPVSGIVLPVLNVDHNPVADFTALPMLNM